MLASKDKLVKDVIAPNLDVLFCGINPGLYTSFTGHHFAGPGNRFYPTLHASGFTPTRLLPEQKDELLPLGLGITNVVMRASPSAAELTKDEMREGAAMLERKVKRYKPNWLAVLGIGTYRTGFSWPKAAVGEQPDHIIGDTRVWVLPNPSGLNAHYSAADFQRVFAELRERAIG